MPFVLDLSQNPKAWLTGDWHLGNKHHDTSLFTSHFDQALAENWGLIHTGDALEMVTVSAGVAQKGAMRDQFLDPKEQRALLKSILSKFSAPGVILPGNHEFRIDAKTGLDFIADVCEGVSNIHALEIPSIVAVKARKHIYHLYLHHGEGPAVSPVTLFDRLQRDVEGIDIIAAGHIHCSTFDPAHVEGLAGERTVHRIRVGHYLKPAPYTLVRPVARRGARGSWLLEFGTEERWIRPTWLG